MRTFLHRCGYHNKAFHNTRLGILNCVQQKKNFEVDIRQTTDQKFVLFHDKVNKSSDAFQKDHHANPTLTEMLTLVNDPTIEIYLDLKDHDLDVQSLLKTLEFHANKIYLGTRNKTLLQKLRNHSQSNNHNLMFVLQISHIQGYWGLINYKHFINYLNHHNTLHLFHEWDAHPIHILNIFNRLVIKSIFKLKPEQSNIVCGAINSIHAKTHLEKLGVYACMPNHLQNV